MEPILLAYSGGPRSAAAIQRLTAQPGAEVVALTLDIGQGGDLEQVRDSALAGGAIRAHVLDAREDFVRDVLVRLLKARALYDRGGSLATMAGKPLIARRLVEIAGIERAWRVAHGSADDAARLDAAVRALDPQLTVVGPDTVPAVDERSSPRLPGECPAESAFVELTFEAGTPTALNGIAMPLLDLVGSLDILAGAHGVGRFDRLETPAAQVLATAHAQLDAATGSPEMERAARFVRDEYVGIVERGDWFTPLKSALDTFVDALQQRVTGRVRLELLKGECAVAETHVSPPPAGTPAGARHPLTFFANAKA